MRSAHNSPHPSNDAAKPTATSVDKQEDCVFSLRLKAEEWAVIQQDVVASGLSRNAYFRQLALDAPVPRQAPKRHSKEYGKVYAKWIGALGKIGSNLNQITRQLNIAMKTDPSQRPGNEELLTVVEQIQELLEASANELRRSLAAKQP